MGGPQDVRVSRVPSKPVRREADGSLAIDLWLRRDGAFEADASLRLTPAEAETLYAQLCYALDDATATLIGPASELPDCRKGILATRRPA
ncbi:hypothetical protein [Streptomyces anulatus]|uniref:Uncharacterized protein n=1 Tax=Streptomyces anulatus TaxID=1892 RepID=A0A7K3RG10_STRAQ|nr:hypothetical protein [Streptomyces anulatus]NEC01051.1 hypothetical protein [Streptomyces anulatus]NED28173.1 hypothetical protein [Streptomyces anulatus]